MDYLDILRMFDNGSHNLPKTAANKVANIMRRLDELTKTKTGKPKSAGKKGNIKGSGSQFNRTNFQLVGEDTPLKYSNSPNFQISGEGPLRFEAAPNFQMIGDGPIRHPNGVNFQLVGNGQLVNKTYNPKKTPMVPNTGSNLSTNVRPMPNNNQIAGLLTDSNYYEQKKNVDDLFKTNYDNKTASDFINKNVKGMSKEDLKLRNQINRDFAWKSGKGALKKLWYNPVTRTAMEVGIPYVGAGIDHALAEDLKRNGHPYWGMFMNGVAGVEALSDTAALAGLAIPVAGEGGYAANMGINTTAKLFRTLVKKAIKNGASKEMAKAYASQEIRRQARNSALRNALMKQHKFVANPSVQIGVTTPALGVDLIGKLFSDDDGGNNGTPTTTPENEQPGNPNTKTPIRTGGIPSGGSDSINQILNGLNLTPDERVYLEKNLREYADNGGDINSLFGIGSDGQRPTTATQPQPIQSVEQQPQSNATISASDRLNNMMNMMRLQQERESYYEPYRRGLRNYLGNYNNMYDSQRASDYALAALSTMPGAENIANVVGKYGALNKEASRLALEKQLADEFAGSQDRQMEAIGNMTMADIVGLDPAVAYGNTKTIDNMLDYDNKRTIEAMKDATKRYGIDERTTLKYYEAQLKDESKRLALAGDWQKALLRYKQALEVAKLNTDGRLQSTLVSSAPYYADVDELKNALQMLGRYNPQQSNTTSQPVTRSGARANVSVNQATNRQKAISDFVDKNK